MIIGHWGEFVPFFLERMDDILFADHLEHPISYYFKITSILRQVEC